MISCGGGGGGSDGESSSETPGGASHDVRVGAHYYLWFPEKFNEGILRTKLSPPQEPQLGIYNSRSRAVVEQHIDSASKAGINFFTLLWSPTNSNFNNAIADTFLQARNLGSINFCLFYGTDELAARRIGGIPIIDEQAKAKFKSDLNYFADNFFSHPQYLKVDGKPVLILYLTRNLVGDYASMINEGRDLLRKRGIEVFLLADEIFWLVIGDGQNGDVIPNVSSDPQADRIGLFDAIFAYNMYEGGLSQHKGYGSESSFINDISALYQRYKAAMPSSVSFVPYAMPGYNDRGVRPSVDHFAIPREFSPGAGETTFFREFVNRLVYPYIDNRNGLVLITSWNEWSEDTAIEPTADAPFTTRDQSSSGDSLTQGYRYSGFGEQYLSAVKELFG